MGQTPSHESAGEVRHVGSDSNHARRTAGHDRHHRQPRWARSQGRDGVAMSRPVRGHMVVLALAGTALALVGGVCGYFGTTFGYRLWTAGRCATSSCPLDEAPWWVQVAGALVASAAYVGLGLLAGIPVRSTAADPASPPSPPGWAERVAAALAHVGL